MNDEWTISTYSAHNEAMRRSEEKFQQERDRRYAEVNSAKEMALKVKEEADTRALSLASEIQKYKDEKANELREQINSERGIYATKADLSAVSKELMAMIKPLVDYVSSNQGRVGRVSEDKGTLMWFISIVALILGMVLAHYWK